ncbi:hypothetical protein GQR58_026500 [Nymphon striatum]|nr:hypothetical protein GQR58_026500 [Nymphon striatum]
MDGSEPSAPSGVPLKFPFLSERLKSLGYSTHAVEAQPLFMVKMVENPGTVNDGLIYAADWFPNNSSVLLEIPIYPMESMGLIIGQYSQKETQSQRNEMVYNILYTKDGNSHTTGCYQNWEI